MYNGTRPAGFVGLEASFSEMMLLVSRSVEQHGYCEIGLVDGWENLEVTGMSELRL